MHYLRARQLAAVTGQSVQPDGTVAPLPAARTNEALAATIAQQTAALEMAATLLSQVPTEIQTLLNAYHAATVQPLASVVSTVQTTATAAQAAAANALTEANKRLPLIGGTVTGPIMVPKATQDTAAPRLEQTYGGLNSPVRAAYGVGTTAVAMGPGPLTDPTPQGRKAKPLLVILTMRVAPTVGATVTIGTTAGGADVFSKSYLLTALPAVNNVLAPMPPVLLELPAGTTLYAKATAGTWDVEVISYYKQAS